MHPYSRGMSPYIFFFTGVMERRHPKLPIGKLGLLDEEKIDASESSIASEKWCPALCKYWSVPHAVFS